MSINMDKIVFLHIPKTGGAAMQYYFYDHLKNRRNYFLSFFGHDDSRFFNDSRATKDSNHCLIESIHKNSKLVDKLNNSQHFKEAKLLFGHTTTSIEELFPEYKFKYLAVVRDPIERTVSNIIQFIKPIKDSNYCTFGKNRIEFEKYTDGFWNSITDILNSQFPVNGLLIHENCYLSDCMTRIFAGDKYLSYTNSPSYESALLNISQKDIKIAYYNRFNTSLQECLDYYHIPINMNKNNKAASGEPSPNKHKSQYGRFYGANDGVLQWIIDNNQNDITLYKKLINE